MAHDNKLLGEFNLDGIPPAPRGMPQIEVTFDIDANGILNVSAAEKSTGKSQKITITNDKGRLSKDDIERLVEESDKYAAEDKLKAEVVIAKNELENYLYNMRNSVEDGKNLDEDDKAKMKMIVDEGLAWLEANADSSKDEYDAKKKELVDVLNPFLVKMYGAADYSKAAEESAHGGPAVEEVD